jgi:hypothetical protein
MTKRERAGDWLERYSSLPLWGPSGSWRRKLIPFLFFCPLGALIVALAAPRSSGWVFWLVGGAVIFVVVFVCSPIAMGPFVKIEGDVDAGH